MSIALANRYADALLEVVSKTGSAVPPQTAIEQLESFLNILSGSPELSVVFQSPAVEVPQKRELVRSLAARLGFAPAVRNFLLILTDNRRMGILEPVCAALRDKLDESRRVARLRITSAKAMPVEQQELVVQRFQQMLGRDVQAAFAEDEELLGGLQVRHGSTVYDGSVRTQLARLERRIAGEV